MRFFLLSWALVFGCAQGTISGCKQEEAPVAKPLPAAPEPAGAPTPSQDLGYGEDAMLFGSPAAALGEILKNKPQAVGFGEYHALEGSAPVSSALHRFTTEIFDELAADSAHLVVETWSVPPCGKRSREVTREVESAIERPPRTESELLMLLRRAREHDVQSHILGFDCEEYSALLTPEGLDSEALLQAITDKLTRAATAQLGELPSDKMLLLYGGSTHNDLAPYPGLEPWSYARALAEATGNRYVEVDLYVPELVEGDPLLSKEAWYPLLQQARDDQLILIRREPQSFILLLRKNRGRGPLPSSASEPPREGSGR